VLTTPHTECMCTCSIRYTLKAQSAVLFVHIYTLETQKSISLAPYQTAPISACARIRVSGDAESLNLVVLSCSWGSF
jgi:hypothetical protein